MLPQQHLECPTLSCAVQFKHLLLPLQVLFPVVTGNAGVGDGFAVLWRGAKQLRFELDKIIPALPSRRALRNQLTFCLPSP